jgi:hypothetical protein
MRRTGIFLVVLSLLLLALPVLAQDEPGTLARGFFLTIKSGMGQQFEAAYKQHIAWHRQQNDTWEWHTWQYETGERLGQYLVRTPGHHWEDFDAQAEFGEADSAHFFAGAGQYVASVSSTFARILPKVSRWPEGDAIPAFVEVLTFRLRYGSGREFNYAIKKVTEAINKSDWPVHYLWLTTVSGGELGTYILVFPHENWAGLNPPEKSFEAMLEEAYGKQEAEEIQKVFDRTIKSERSQISVYRPDLSYIPGQ